MRFGESVGRFQHPLDRSRRHRRCAVCGGGAFSWVLTFEGRSICTACYQDVQPRVTVCESENGGDPPWSNGISDSRATMDGGSQLSRGRTSTATTCDPPRALVKIIVRIEG